MRTDNMHRPATAKLVTFAWVALVALSLSSVPSICSEALPSPRRCPPGECAARLCFSLHPVLPPGSWLNQKATSTAQLGDILSRRSPDILGRCCQGGSQGLHDLFSARIIKGVTGRDTTSPDGEDESRGGSECLA